MTRFARFAARLRQQLLRWYEMALCAALLAMALAVVSPSPAAVAEEEAAQCGNIQSSADVITR